MTCERFCKLLIFLVLLLYPVSVFAQENIDPDNDDSQYAWGEIVGWINLEPDGDGGPGVEVGDTQLTGFMWGENIGWINASPTGFGVANDGNGNLSGYAWSENCGWVSFSCKNTGSCTTASYGVTISPTTGEFNGFAWAENLGWINFAPDGVSIKTSWRGGGYSKAANAEAATYGSSSLTGSGISNEVILLFIPVGAVIALKILRRKRYPRS